MNKGIFAVPFIALMFLFSLGFLNPQEKSFGYKELKDTIFPSSWNASAHQGQMKTSSEGLLHFATGLDNEEYLIGEKNRTGYLLIETRTDRSEVAIHNRPPLNISIVIDRSGSMSGVKLGNAKKAAKQIIHELKQGDWVSIVIYDQVAESIQDPIEVNDKTGILSKIDRITDRGSTNLWGGADMGYRFIKDKIKEGYINRVLLISDGLANAGVTDPKLISYQVQKYKDESGITISTFGVGLDYNELLMTEMAERGSGNYYFIDSVQKMAAICRDEMNGMSSAIAQNAELRISIPDEVELIKTFPVNYSVENGELVIKMRELYSDETRPLMIHFKIKDNAAGQITFHSRFVAKDMKTGELVKFHHENFLRPAVSKETYVRLFNKKVIEQAILFTANNNLEEAMVMIDQGDYEKAKQSVGTNTVYLKKNAVYVKDNRELSRMDSINTVYATQSDRAESMDQTEMKMLQKSNRAESYKIRNKKIKN